MNVEWIICIVLATLALYSWREARKAKGETLVAARSDQSPMSQAEIKQLATSLGQLVVAKQSREQPLAEALLGSVVAAMLVRSESPMLVARFLRGCADSVEHHGATMIEDARHGR